MRNSLEKDTEGLLSDQDARSSESSEISWPDISETSKRPLRDWRLPSIPIIFLCITNITTLAFLFITIPSSHTRPTCRALNHPPTGVAPTLAHLVREPSPELFNVTFYPHDQPFRQRNTIENDKLWEEYTQSSRPPRHFPGAYIITTN